MRLIPKNNIVKLRQFLIFSALFASIMAVMDVSAIDGAIDPTDAKLIGRQTCVGFALQYSFEVRLARLAYSISETDIRATEAMYDTYLSGAVTYSEDRRSFNSVFGAPLALSNVYSAAISKKFPTGTEINTSLNDVRSWNNSGFVVQNPAHTTELEVNARQPIARNAFGYNDRRTVSITKLAVMNSDAATQDSIESLISNVEKAYWTWVFYKRSLALYQGMYKKAKELEELNNRNFDLGRIEKGDMYAAKANVKTTEADLALAKNRYRDSEETLKGLINMDPLERLKPAETLEYNPSMYELQDCLLTALRSRRDYKIALRETEVKKINLEIKRNEKLPEIDLVGTFAANGIDSSPDEAANKMLSNNNT